MICFDFSYERWTHYCKGHEPFYSSSLHFHIIRVYGIYVFICNYSLHVRYTLNPTFQRIQYLLLVFLLEFSLISLVFWMSFECRMTTALVFYCCHNKFPQTSGLNNTDLLSYSSRSPKCDKLLIKQQSVSQQTCIPFWRL